MKITLNQITHEVQPGATLTDALTLLQARPPFAVAVNMQFVPNTRYAQTPLRRADALAVLFPVTGG
mgnify:FL=1